MPPERRPWKMKVNDEKKGKGGGIKKEKKRVFLCVKSENIKHKPRIVRGEGEREKNSPK